MRIRYRDMSLDSDYFSGTITGMNVDEYDDFSFRRTTFRSRSVTPDTRSGIGTDSVKVSTTSAKRLLKTMPTK